jgi:hypothetical protein
MSTVESALTKFGFGVAKPRAQAWKLTPAKPVEKAAAPKRSWLGLFRRPEPTTYQRCLAVHIHFAGPHSHLS